MGRSHCPRTRGAAGALLGLAALFLSAAAAMGQPAGQVGYTEVLGRRVHRTIALPGSVESQMASVVAAEVRGLVVAVEAREGDHVREGQPLVRLRTVFLDLQLRAAQGRLKEAEARLELAESKLKRATELFRDEIISQDEQDDAFSEFTAWQGRVDQTRAEIASLEEAIDRCVVRAPFSGVVVLEHSDVGEWVDEGGPVVDMVALDQLEVRVEAPERYYDLIRGGVEAMVRFEALLGIEVRGRVTGVIPRADDQARSFPIKVRIPNPDGRIGVGMLAEVSLPVGETYDALLVPKDALVRQGEDEIVFRINGDQTVDRVPVVSGQGVGPWVVVRGPVTAGERVVTRGNERLFPGQAVQGEPQEYPLP